MQSKLKNYNETINYLYGLRKHGIKLGLDNIKGLMNILGGPHKSFHCIHIAGTNGKGSTATAIASILAESGLRTGLFTSPHLLSFTERIRINGESITESEVIDLATGIRQSIRKTGLNPTFFEFVTAMAFYYFAKRNVDWAVIETGMGGRLDATNVVHPDLTVITNISRDHSEFLGNKISDITYEKAGIIKPGVPVITASQIPDVVSQLSGIAKKRNAEIHIYNKDFSGSPVSMDKRETTLDYAGYGKYKNLRVPLPGEYQLFNICTAVRACEILKQREVPISDTSMRAGLQNVSLEGRLERVSDDPPIILDSAHNPEAAGSLALSVKRLFADRKIILVAGIMDDKDIHGILNPLVEISESVILTRAGYDRAASPEKMEEIMAAIQDGRSNGRPLKVHKTGTVSEAINLAKSICPRDGIILVAGSFYTSGEVKEVLGCKSVLPGLRE